MSKGRRFLGNDPFAGDDDDPGPESTADAKPAEPAAPAPAKSRVRLPDDLRIGSVAYAREQLLGADLGAEILEIDATGVAYADTAGVQLVLSWLRGVRSRGIALRWTGRSEALDDIAVAIGLGADLGVEHGA